MKRRYASLSTGFIICLLLSISTTLSAQQNEAKIKDQDAITFNNEGIRQIKAQRYEAAIILFDQALSLQPNNALTYYNLGSAYFHLQQFEKALNSYQKAIKLEPDFAEAHNNLGTVFQAMGQYDKAVESFKKAIHFNMKTGNLSALYNLGCTYIYLKNFKAAIDPLEQAARLGAGTAEIHLTLGYVYSREKLFQHAIAEIQKAVSLDPKDERAQFLLGKIYLLVNDKQAALIHYTRLKTQSPELAEKLYQAIYKDKIVAVQKK